MPVGSAGFFIDVGVLHPKQPDTFIVGILCDGKQYYAQTSVTDRDDLQLSVLHSKGWQLYSVWLVDWFKNRDLVIQQLLDYLANL